MPTVTPREFFEALYPDPVKPGRLVLWSKLLRSGRKHTDWCYNLRQAARLIEKYRHTRDVYFGVALQDQHQALKIARSRRPRATAATVRGGIDSVTAIPALWADIDVAGPGHSSDTLPPDRASALSLLEAVPQPPSVLVDSGGGFHAYWLLRELWELETKEERCQAQELVRRLQWAIQNEAAAKGWQIDHTADLARVLRVPGTMNHKRGTKRPVTVEQFPIAADKGRYSVHDFDDLPEAPDAPAERSWPGDREPPSDDAWRGDPADLRPVWRGCSWIRHCHDDRASLPEPEWFAALSIVGRCATENANGRQIAQRFSRDHPGYTPEATDDKLGHAMRGSGPRTCEHIAYKLGAWDGHCSDCPNWGRLRSPIVLGRRSRLEPTVVDRAKPGSQGPPPAADREADKRPEILIHTREDRVNDQALTALAAAEPNLFERGGLLVEVTHSPSQSLTPWPPLPTGAAQAAPDPRERGNADRFASSGRLIHEGEGGGAPLPGGMGAGGRGDGGEGPGGGAIRHAPGTPLARTVQEARLQELLAQHCAFVVAKTNRDGVEMRPAHPPRWTVRALLARGSWPQLPLLQGLVEGPVLRADGSVLQEPGYDPRTGLVYAPTADFLPVPERPSVGERDEALRLLREVVCDFPFKDDVHFSAWLSSLLTPLGRPAFEGPSPLNLIDANIRGAGKSLLADVVSTILTGRPAARMSYSRDEDEIRKAITGLAVEGTRLVLIDNVSGVFGSPTLDRALTAWTWRDRLLGSNEHVELPLQMTWYATGNNVALHADTPRRCLHIRLESPEERPEERTVFRHPRLLSWIRERRARILPAALTLLRAYVDAGRPAQQLPGMGSYESWSELVRSTIVWLGLPDPAATRDDLELAAGTDVGLLAAFLEGLEELFGELGGEATAREMVEALSAEGNQDRFVGLRSVLRELFPRHKSGDLPTTSQLGFKLRSFTGRLVDGRCVTQTKKSSKGATWALRKTKT